MAIVIKDPQYAQNGITIEDPSVSKLAHDLQLIKHPNGGYFAETDRPSGLHNVPTLDPAVAGTVSRTASSMIHFLMTCESPLGRFHTNVTGRTIHVLQGGRGIYVLVHPDGHIETFNVGFDVANGERTQWVVEPGVYKACYIAPANEGATISNKDRLWVTEVVVPGFDFQDMKFPNVETLRSLVGDDKATELQWLL